jgi:DNA-binding IclR family transcriptional regulator
MRDLAERCGESVFLALLDRTEVVYVRRMESPHSVMMVRKLGHRAPVYATATGEAMLAFLPEEEQDAIIREMDFAEHSAQTNTDPDALRRELATVREEGVAVVDGEYNPELLCISAPIFGAEGTVEAAITVAMPSAEASAERIASVAEAVRENALGVSRQMGYVGAPSGTPEAASA